MISKWKGILGQSFSIAAFAAYIKTLHWTGWRPSFIVLHNTAIPDLAARPEGFTAQHIANLENFYKNKQNWSGGPHLFIDDRQIWVFTPLTTSGVHSPSWNKVSIGIEMLGDYNVDSFTDGRGAKVRDNAVAAVAILNDALGFHAEGLHVHNEDPGTTHKGCPGKHVVKEDFIKLVDAYMDDSGEHSHPV